MCVYACVYACVCMCACVGVGVLHYCDQCCECNTSQMFSCVISLNTMY